VIIPSTQRQAFGQNFDLSVKGFVFIDSNRTTCFCPLNKTKSDRCYTKYKIEDLKQEIILRFYLLTIRSHYGASTSRNVQLHGYKQMRFYQKIKFMFVCLSTVGDTVPETQLYITGQEGICSNFFVGAIP